MTFRLVDVGWRKELKTAVSADSTFLRIICPFIKIRALEFLLEGNRPASLRVITRFNLTEFAEGVSDIAALRALLGVGAHVRGVRNLHAKLYLFGSAHAILTSANLTDAALDRNHEFGFVCEHASIAAKCRAYFDALWVRGGTDLTVGQLDSWDEAVKRYLATGARSDRPSGLDDHGADAGILAVSPMPLQMADTRQAFVKFLGEGNNRVPLSFRAIDEVERSGCHWAVAYPASQRPRIVEDGAVIFISRLTYAPNDIRVFGRAIGLRHVPGRDDATHEDVERRAWKARGPHYIRVHHAEFVAGSMANGVSLTWIPRMS
jgi:hypothetical protein